jgi:hypothetical protein
MEVEEEIIDVDKICFHPILKDIENMFWFFLLSIRTLSDFDVQNILKIKDSKQEGYLCFFKTLDKFNDSTNLQIERKDNRATSKMNVLKEMVFMGKSMSIMTYELLAVSKYREFIKDDEEFIFLKFIRNGAAHDNKFDFKYKYGKNKDQWMIGESEIIKWNKMEISRKLQNKEVFNNFISIVQIFSLAKYFSEKLVMIDKK